MFLYWCSLCASSTKTNTFRLNKNSSDFRIGTDKQIDQRIEEIDNYIEARSKVTNTDERDIAGIIENYDEINGVIYTVSESTSYENAKSDVIKYMGK